ncbi:allantoinase [Cristinia sonorae]|uniref:allantoinase n=1 Tax=Cristinia sonorae TaxID=1940300 RepID=A0A8K0XLZ1_9AGAR|nr:allantoinase [Cristinia sonorae]
MPLNTRIFTSNSVLLPENDSPVPATIVVDALTGKIIDLQHGLAQRAQFPGITDSEWFDADDHLILPGLVDAHVHLNEPGRTDWEGFWTGTRAAASGGVTTLIDMPLNSIPPTTTVNNFEQKKHAARGQCWTDVGFWGGVIPGNQAHLRPLVEARVKGFKCFLIESGVEEFPCVAEADLRDAMKELEGSTTVLCFHAELETGLPDDHEHSSANATLYETFLHSRPQSLETAAIELITRLHAEHPTLRLHIVHLSASNALPLIRAARSSGLPLTVETCFHYLTLDATSIPNGRPEFKCCPPIREAANRDELWDALKKGDIDCVVSDHSPCVAELKNLDEGDVMNAWGGISTLGLGLSLLWTEGRKRGVSVRDIVRWCCEETAKHAGLQNSKGALRVGMDADLIVWDPEAEVKVTKESLNFKNKLTPYEGLSLKGRVLKTFLRGNLVYDSVTGFEEKPIGQLL